MNGARLLVVSLLVGGLLWGYGCGKGGQNAGGANNTAGSSNTAAGADIMGLGSGGAGAAEMMLPPSSNDLSGQVVDGVRVIKLQASQWVFDPSNLVVKQGEKVRILATSTDVTHGFGLPAFGIDQQIEPNQETAIEFTADRTGDFPFRCTVYCGDGHEDMKGTLTVQ